MCLKSFPKSRAPSRYEHYHIHAVLLVQNGVTFFFFFKATTCHFFIQMEIHWLGGRTFLVINLAPIGCYPRFLAEQSNNLYLDESGCKISYNNAVNEYNNMLKDALQQTRKDLSGANVIYVNTNAALLNLYQNPKSHGKLIIKQKFPDQPLLYV